MAPFSRLSRVTEDQSAADDQGESKAESFGIIDRNLGITDRAVREHEQEGCL